MDKSKFIETRDYVTYRINTRFTKYDYHINKKGLDKSRNHDPYTVGDRKYENVSEWVCHLSEKGWASKRMMLLLCDIIKRVCPDNKIDWEETYRFIENSEYETI